MEVCVGMALVAKVRSLAMHFLCHGAFSVADSPAQVEEVRD
jgi:hypothetical protein